MPRVAPAARIRIVQAVANLQRLRREMGRLSEKNDEDYQKKKRALAAVIKELRMAVPLPPADARTKI